MNNPNNSPTQPDEPEKQQHNEVEEMNSDNDSIGKTKDPPKLKKNGLLSRTLKEHDLDSLLVYDKRQRGPAKITFDHVHRKPAVVEKLVKPKLKAQVKREKLEKKDQDRGKQVIKKRVVEEKQKVRKPRPQNPAVPQVNPSRKNAKEPSVDQQIVLQHVPSSQEDKLQRRQPLIAEQQPKISDKPVQVVRQAIAGTTVLGIEPPSTKIQTVPPIEQIKPEQVIADQGEEVSSRPSNDTRLAGRPKRNAHKKKIRRYSDDSDFQGRQALTEFPIANYIAPEVQNLYLQHASQVDDDRNRRREEGHVLNSSTFISCDVKYFNWSFFADRVGNFEVVLIDPPWRIKGAQQNDSQFMFSNCKFNLQYNTMSNKDIGKVGVDKLSDCGFIFLWILNTQLNASIQILNGWGYELIDQIVWVKTKDHKIYLTHGYYFMHSYEICLVGYKHNPNKRVGCLPHITSNVLIAEVRKKSQKPDELYELIELMFPSTKKIEVYARNNNLRFGWFSLGNQLGESYDKWLLMLHCDKCHCALKPNTVRYKAKRRANYDLCERCMTEENKEDFFQILNQADQDVIHLYRSCNNCGTEPIWGTRFECLTCRDFDLCESTLKLNIDCYDLNLTSEQKFHDIMHETAIVEIPIFGHGFHLHDFKCNACSQKPIIGICFSCKSCRYNLCQMCFFQRNAQHPAKASREEHHLEAIFDPTARPVDKKFACFSCKTTLTNCCWMCQNCYGFYFCESCYEGRKDFKTQQASSHKNYHHFIRLF